MVVEDTFDWYAQSKDGAVWYFGEDTTEFLAAGALVRQDPGRRVSTALCRGS